MRMLLLFCWLLLFYSCQNPLHNALPDFGEEFELSFGEKITLGSDNVSVEFIDVLEDSRCPVNVTCIWAGNGKVKLRYSGENINLNTYLEPKDTTLSEVNIQLLNLEPYPEHPVQTEKEDYKVHLLITKQ